MNKINKLIFVLALSGLVYVNGYGQKETPPAGGVPKDFKLPGKKVTTLANGLSAVTVNYGSVPKVNINIVIKTGNAHEKPDQVWLADLTGKLMQQGTATLSFKEIADKAAAMGGDVSVSVGMNTTSVSGSVLSEFAPDLVRLLADILINPAFPASELDRIKNDLKRDLSVQISVPQNQAAEKFFAMIFPDHPYGQYFPTEKMLDSYTLEMSKEFYNANFGAKRTRVYVVGKFDEASVLKSVEEAFGQWKSGPEAGYPEVKELSVRKEGIIDRPNAPQTTIMLGLPTLTPTDSDYIALSVTNAILGGSFGSRITSNIREDKGYTYSPFSTILNRKGASVWYEQADVTSAFTSASLNEIAKEIKHLQEEAPPREELEGIQNYQAGIFVLQNSSPQGIIGQLNFLDLYGLPDSYLTNQVKNIYAVTPSKINEIAQKYFNYDKMTLVMVGDKKLLEKQKKEQDSKLKKR
jgi:zinc protease